MKEPRKNASKTRGRPFEKGNPGRPKGSRHKATLAVEALLDGDAEALARKAIEKAKEGDITALRLCLDRICPPRKDRTVSIKLPKVETPEETVKAIGAVLEAVSRGDLAPGEGQALAAMIETQRRTLETENIERRITALEGK